MNEIAISVRDVAVRFRPYVDRNPTLRRSVGRRRARETIDVVALDRVSFDVQRGEAFGIVGPNGAGKSTLLRLLARTMRPDEGQVRVDGKTSTLLQLGVGFNPELSGRRNVFLGGLAHGLRIADVRKRYDSIVEYAGLQESMARPLKTYSSGMFSRLAFSISMHLDPDILLLDEVLAVGDQAFREKSLQAMRELLDRSGTIVFVSHNLENLAEFCDRAMWLQSGQVEMVGEAVRVVDAYRAAASGAVDA